MVKAKCQQCGIIYLTKPSWIKRGRKFCSRKCYIEDRKTGKLFKCSVCSNRMWRTKAELKKSKSGNFFCSKSCQTIWRNKHYSAENHANWQNGRGSYRSRLIRSKTVQKCRLCGISDIRVLTAHHKDENREHNELNNLEWVCFNCHFLIHKYK